MISRPSLNVFLFPSANKNNKYIDLFSVALQKVRPHITIFVSKNDALTRVIPYVGFARTRGVKNIIHIQWSTVVYGSRFALKSLFLLAGNMFLLLVLKVFFRFKIVWTIHNFFAHDYPHPNIDALGRRAIFAVSDCVIVQQQTTLSEYRARYPRKNIHYVPHGNYIGAYGMPVKKDQGLLKSLGFQNDDVVLLSLGVIAPYKLNEKIIDAVIAARKEASHLKLLIIGKGNPSYVETLIQRASSDPGIIIRNGFVADADVPRYLSIADYSIFYYDQSEMTSGGMILSLSYGVPVIIRNIPAAEIVGDTTGYVFRDENELKDILSTISPSLTGKTSDIIDDARTFDWEYSAKSLVAIYDQL